MSENLYIDFDVIDGEFVLKTIPSEGSGLTIHLNDIQMECIVEKAFIYMKSDLRHDLMLKLLRSFPARQSIALKCYGGIHKD